MSKYITKSEKQTISLGKKIAGRLKGGEVLALTGDLGAGKTTLIKGIAQGLGIKKIITSPTFVLMKIYSTNPPTFVPSSGRGKASRPENLLFGSRRGGAAATSQLIHIDCYRIKSTQEIIDIGAAEYFGRDDTIVVIEWAEKIKKILPKNSLNVKISHRKNEKERSIIIMF